VTGIRTRLPEPGSSGCKGVGSTIVALLLWLCTRATALTLTKVCD